ncbi:dihydroxyacetone kinase subunit DhaL [Christensenella timonensis]|uniref:dihydroxyacetone kinase subunit DhaL n=1 Tax=Christensenella timonensis TaxID=1816678 RepID=UPI0008375847|nr:dihydroxyacetone kinase subunit DhaL [Christensenella timonensis]
MEQFKNSDGKVIVEKMIKVIQENKDYLGTVDGAIGDGDHGINMNKGFTICAERIAGQDCTFSEALVTLGDVLLSEIGGSMGPIYGTLFIEMGETSQDKEEIDSALFLEMVKNAVEGLSALVDARIGDKTLMDVMLPAEAALEKAVAEGKPFDAALDDFAAAAESGRDSTKDMVAKFGRASRLGERSRGVLDAGSVSCALLLRSMSDAIQAM